MNLKKLATAALALTAATVLTTTGALPASAAPFDGTGYSQGHFDVVLEIEKCAQTADGTWAPSEWDIKIEDHDNDLTLNEGDYFYFQIVKYWRGAGAKLGFAVEYAGDNCMDSSDNPLPGVDTFSFSVGDAGVTTNPAGSIVLTGDETPEPYHQDVEWSFPNGGGDYLVGVTVANANGTELGSTTLAMRAQA